jgi:hypothetical protein
LIEIALDVTILTPVIVSSPACTVVRGLIGQRLWDLRCMTGAPTCSGCPVAAACDYGRIFEGGSPHPFWLQGIPATTELNPGAQIAARLYLAAPAHMVAQYLDVTLRDAFRALDPRCSPLGVTGARPHPGRVDAGGAPHRRKTGGSTSAPRRRCGCGATRRSAGRCVPGRRGWRSWPGPHPAARCAGPRVRAAIRRQAAPGGATRPLHRRADLRRVHSLVVVDGPHLAALAPLLRALTVTSLGKSTSLGLGTLRVVTS